MPLNLEYFGSEDLMDLGEDNVHPPHQDEPTRKKQEIGAGVLAVEHLQECSPHFRRVQGRPVVSTAATDIS